MHDVELIVSCGEIYAGGAKMASSARPWQLTPRGSRAVNEAIFENASIDFRVCWVRAGFGITAGTVRAPERATGAPLATALVFR